MLNPVYLKEWRTALKEHYRRIILGFVICVVIYVFIVPISCAIKSLGILALFVNLRLNVVSVLITLSIPIFAFIMVINRIKKNELPTPKSIIIYIFIILSYLLFRFSGEYSYVYIFENIPISYFDVLFVFLPVFAWYYARYADLVVANDGLHFWEDEHNIDEQDLLGRNNEITPENRGVISLVSETINKIYRPKMVGKICCNPLLH